MKSRLSAELVYSRGELVYSRGKWHLVLHGTRDELEPLIPMKFLRQGNYGGKYVGGMCADFSVMYHEPEEKEINSEEKEINIVYTHRVCQKCHLSEFGLEEVACPNCGAMWPENLIARSLDDGKPMPWIWSAHTTDASGKCVAACEGCRRVDRYKRDLVGAFGVDVVDHPAHYGGKDDPFETIKVLEVWLPRLPLKPFEAALMFNVIKYLSRAGVKGELLEDLEKSAWYLTRLIENVKRRKT